ncbi:MAG TPA: tripartite tricarboxylate transporter substrate binding protein [Xanthobacteraceae bacterium]|nr:tripartite tricarboxylate transporter substrate binding protein [Xanthobacteraceae bacterium]
MGRNGFLRTLCVALASLALLAANAHAQTDNYPSKNIRVIVGFAAGGGNDLIARVVAQELQNALGQTVVVENRVGAGGRVAAEYVMREPPDGHTLLVGASGAMAISPAVIEKIPYVTLRDFAPVSMIASFPLVMATSIDHPAKTVKEFVAWAKANPDKSNYGTTSPAFTLTVELLKLKSGAPITAIPYKSGNEMVMSVMSNNSSMTIVDPPPAVPQIQAGKLRGLAVTATTRMEELPDVPTMPEAGYPDVLVSLWNGIFAPPGTPKPIVQKLETEIRRIMQLPDVKQKFRTMATIPVGSTSQEFIALIEKETAMWRGVAKDANLKFE